MRIEIVKHAECGPSVSHIESVGILKNAGEIVLLEVNLRTKNKQPDAYGGRSVFVGGEEIIVHGLPPAPEGRFWHCFAETARYTMMVCFYCCELSKHSKVVWNKVEQ